MTVVLLRGFALPEGEPVDLYADGDRWTTEPVARSELVAEGWLVPGLVDAHTPRARRSPAIRWTNRCSRRGRAGVPRPHRSDGWPGGMGNSLRRGRDVRDRLGLELISTNDRPTGRVRAVDLGGRCSNSIATLLKSLEPTDP